MKIPTKTIDFEEEGYTDEAGAFLWLKVPRSVLEGDVNDIQELNAKVQAAGADLQPKDVRALNIKVLSFVREWNFDNAKGKVHPLPHTLIADGEPSQALIDVIKEIPMEVINKTVRVLTNQEVDKSSR